MSRAGTSGLGEEDRRDWLRLIRSENVGPRTFHELLRRYRRASAAIAALPELSRRGGRRMAVRIYAEDAASREIEALAAMGGRLIALPDPEYPALLRQIADPPPVLSVMGTADILSRPAVAIVGARNASALGRKMAANLAADLGSSGQVIASGLARGIDAAAHRAALSTGTVAVMAGGMDIIYPPENRDLARAISEHGALVTEVALGTQPTRTHFPRRNRLVSGVSTATIVIDAAARSGSLITARFALEQNREVFAVPGSPLDARAAGTNALIRDGATLVRDARDVLEVLEPMVRTLSGGEAEPYSLMEPDTPPPGAPDASTREALLSLLSVSPVDIDDLVRESGADAGDVMGVLLELEIAGRLDRFSGQRVALAP